MTMYLSRATAMVVYTEACQGRKGARRTFDVIWKLLTTNY